MKNKVGRPFCLLLAVLLLALTCMPMPAAAADVDLEVTPDPNNHLDKAMTIFVGETLKLRVNLGPPVETIDMDPITGGIIHLNTGNINSSQVIEVTGLIAGTVELNFNCRWAYSYISGGKITFTVRQGFPITITQTAGGTVTPAGNSSGVLYVPPYNEPVFKAAADTGYHFDHFILDGSPVNSGSELALPPVSEPHSISVVFKPNSHLVTVVDGSGSGTYDYNSTVPITADPAPHGMHFVGWGGNIIFADPNAVSTSFVMPNDSVLIQVMYDYNIHTVTVNGGMGNGAYTYGDTVTITADAAPRGMRFQRWDAAGVTLANPRDETTSFSMPDGDVTVTAVYRKISVPGPGYTDAGLDLQSAAFDRNPDAADNRDVTVTLSPGSYSLDDIRLRGVLLTAGKDYSVSGGSYTFKKEFLTGLSEGDHRITFGMSGGTDPVLTVTVKDSTEAWSNPFSDVQPGDWFYGDVEYAHQKGLFLGTAENRFSPNTPVTRAMAVTVLGRAAGIDPSAHPDSAFDDVELNTYYAPYSAWAKELGIVEGIGDGLFAPGNPITREDLSLMFYRYADAMDITLDETREPGGFADQQSIRAYAGEAVDTLYRAGVINGKPGKLFDPRGTATRAETAAMLHRFPEV